MTTKIWEFAMFILGLNALIGSYELDGWRQYVASLIGTLLIGHVLDRIYRAIHTSKEKVRS